MIRHATAAGFLFILLCGATLAIAQERRIEVLKEQPPADRIAPPIREKLQPTGWRVLEGEDDAICEIWLFQEVGAAPDFSATSELQYPFVPGQLMGVIRLPGRMDDFRQQQIPRGVYTLRYAQQPVDGNHVGTFPTRDFLLMVKVEDDRQGEPIPMMRLQEMSAESAGTAHPALLCLLKPAEKAAPQGAIRHDEQHDWWIAQLPVKAKAGERTDQIGLSLVVAGFAEE